MNCANENDHSLCHDWHQWEHFDPEDHNKDNKMRLACIDIMFDNIKQWCVVNGNKKQPPDSGALKTITKTPDDAQGGKTPDDKRNDKTPSPRAKHVSFDITMTQAKKLFTTQMSKLRHQAVEKEHFEINTLSYKEAAPLLTTF